MCYIGFNGEHESVCIITIKEADSNAVVAFKPGRPDAVHPVHDAHGLTVHDDGREPGRRGGQSPHVLEALAGQPRRVAHYQ